MSRLQLAVLIVLLGVVVAQRQILGARRNDGVENTGTSRNNNNNNCGCQSNNNNNNNCGCQNNNGNQRTNGRSGGSGGRKVYVIGGNGNNGQRGQIGQLLRSGNKQEQEAALRALLNQNGQRRA